MKTDMKGSYVPGLNVVSIKILHSSFIIKSLYNMKNFVHGILMG